MLYAVSSLFPPSREFWGQTRVSRPEQQAFLPSKSSPRLLELFLINSTFTFKDCTDGAWGSGWVKATYGTSLPWERTADTSAPQSLPLVSACNAGRMSLDNLDKLHGHDYGKVTNDWTDIGAKGEF